MKIIKGSITTLASEGRLTLQVPDTCLFIGSSGSTPPPVNYQVVPDNWFCRLKGGTHEPCMGKQKGFLFLTEEGFMANYQDIKDAFENAIARGLDRTGGQGWSAFLQYAKNHFAEVKAKKAKLIAKRQKEIRELNNFNI